MRNYRGKRIDNGEWVYGSAVKSGDCRWFIFPRGFALQKTRHLTNEYVAPFSEVIPETVGQSTGRKDKNGVKVYERGVVKFSGHDYLAEVKYYPEYAAFLFDSHNEETRNNPQAIMTWDASFEVIGTAHELILEKK